jgi:hypothetical protein
MTSVVRLPIMPLREALQMSVREARSDAAWHLYWTAKEAGLEAILAAGEIKARRENGELPAPHQIEAIRRAITDLTTALATYGASGSACIPEGRE